MYVVKIYSSWHFALLREQGRLRNKPKLFQVKIDEVTPTKLANKISLGHFAVGNKFTGLALRVALAILVMPFAERDTHFFSDGDWRFFMSFTEVSGHRHAPLMLPPPRVRAAEECAAALIWMCGYVCAGRVMTPI